MEKECVSKRLDKSIQFWQDVCFLIAQLNILGIKKKVKKGFKFDFRGPIKHCGDFRKHVLEQAVSGNYDYDRFTGSYEISAGMLRAVGSLPVCIFSWNHYSRRVFSLSSEMQALLSATSLEGYKWWDIKWPFKSFILTLEDPLVGAGGVEYDCVLVGEVSKFIMKRDDTEMIEFVLLPKILDQYEPINRFYITQAVKNNRMRVEDLRAKILSMTGDVFDQFFVTTRGIDGRILQEDVTVPVMEYNEAFEERLIDAGHKVNAEFNKQQAEGNEDVYAMYAMNDKVKHLVCSVCLYMESIYNKNVNRPDDLSGSGVYKKSSILSSKVITDPEDICTITLENTEHRGVVSAINKSRASGEKSVHWRRGHWRREWGSYGATNAQKVWIKPCLVNKDRLQSCALPLAGKSNL